VTEPSDRIRVHRHQRFFPFPSMALAAISPMDSLHRSA
jgi:hypothetical protein